MRRKKNVKFAAFDAVLTVLILSALVAVFIRIVIGEEGLFPEDNKTEGTYAVVLTSDGENNEGSAKRFTVGDDIYLASGELLGKVSSVTSKSTQVHVSGVMTDSGFLMNGTFYLAPNMKLELRSDDATVSVTVSDITFLS